MRLGKPIGEVVCRSRLSGMLTNTRAWRSGRGDPTLCTPYEWKRHRWGGGRAGWRVDVGRSSRRPPFDL